MYEVEMLKGQAGKAGYITTSSISTENYQT